MAAIPPDVIEPSELTDADEAILDELHHGARTKKAIVDATGLHRNTVGNRLDVLEAGDAVGCIHETTALWELQDDPRGEDGGEEDDTVGPILDRLETALSDAEAALEQQDGDGIADALKTAQGALQDAQEVLDDGR